MLLLFSHPVMSNSFRPHRLQHARPPSLSPSPRVCLSSCSLHWWCCPAISSSDALFSFCPQSFPESGTFCSQKDDQSTRASASVLLVNIQHWSPLRLTGLISLLSKGLSGVFSSTTVQRHQFFGILPSLWSSSHNCHDHWEDSLDYLQGYLIALTVQTFVNRVNVSAFQHTKFVLASLPRSSCFLISWLQSPSAVILEPKKREFVTTSTFSPSILADAMILVVLIFCFKLALSLSSFTLIKRLSSLRFLSLKWHHPRIWDYWYLPAYLDSSL